LNKVSKGWITPEENWQPFRNDVHPHFYDLCLPAGTGNRYLKKQILSFTKPFKPYLSPFNPQVIIDKEISALF
jgi:hypothetical protein